MGCNSPKLPKGKTWLPLILLALLLPFPKLSLCKGGLFPGSSGPAMKPDYSTGLPPKTIQDLCSLCPSTHSRETDTSPRSEPKLRLTSWSGAPSLTGRTNTCCGLSSLTPWGPVRIPPPQGSSQIKQQPHKVRAPVPRSCILRFGCPLPQETGS